MANTTRFLIALPLILTPTFAAAEDITVFDAACERESIRVCMAAFIPRKVTTASGALLYCGERRAEAQKAARPAVRKAQVDQVVKDYPEGCYDIPSLIGEKQYCPMAGKLNEKCVRTITVMTPADIQLLRDSFTKQLGDWLAALERAGVVSLSTKAAP